MLQTAFAHRFMPADAEVIEVCGHAAPLVVTDPVEEYTAVRERLGLYDFSMLHKYDVRGPEALAAIDAAVCRDLTRVAPGRIAYGPVVGDDGGMLDDSTVFVFGPDHVRVVGGDGVPGAVDAAVSGRDCTATPVREALAHLTLQGPKSREVLARIAAFDVSNDAFPYYTFRDGVDVAGIPALVSRMGFSAELGYEIYIPRDRADDLWDAIQEAAAGLDPRAIGGAAVMMIRIEAGMVMGDGLEYDATVSPWECGLGWAVNLDKPSFRGKDALARRKESDTGRVVSVRLSGGEDRATGAPLFHGEDEVGHVTMSIPSPFLGFATLGLARVHRDLAAPGTRLEARLEEGAYEAEIVSTPVYDPERARPELIMRLLVCVKQVGVLGDEIELDASGLDVDPDYLERALNEWDAAAIEEALVLREAAGSGEVVLVTAGDDEADETIRRGLAMGADRAIRIDLPTGTALDPVGVGALLADVARQEAPDLVLCGAQSSDAAHGATGAALAGHLGWPCAAVVRRLAWQAGAPAVVGRELEGGVIAETRIELPAVLTIQTGINQPRYATLRQIKQAAENDLQVVEPAGTATHARVLRMYAPERGAGAEMLGDDADVIAARIVELVRGEAR